MRCSARTGLFAVALCSSLAAMPGQAQTEEADSRDGEAAKQMEKVEVVGSRIKRVDLETSQPVIVLDREYIERTGLTAVGDILQRLVVHGEGNNTAMNEFGNGEIRVNLRNLGSSRTLVLLNGRRWVPGLDGAVDLTAIPLAIVDRIEVLKDGGSAIYGSDAIAGVVNIVTRERYEGIELSAYVGAFEQGDGETQSYDLSWGHNWDRGSAQLGLTYTRQEPVFARDRDISAVPRYNLPPGDTAAFGSPGTPYGRFLVMPGQPRQTLIAGRSGEQASDFRAFDARNDAFNTATDRFLLTPQERTGLYGQMRYDLTERMRFSGDLLLNRRINDLQVASTILEFPSTLALAFGDGIAADNLYNPFDLPVRVFSRRLVEAGPRTFDQDVDTVRIAAGLDGGFEWGERAYSWDVQATHSRSDRADGGHGLVDLLRVAESLGPSFRDAQGTPRCGTPDDVIAGCVPLNVFGGPGSISPEMADYILIDVSETSRTQTDDFAANLTGDLFELPYGALAFATGYEYRREQGDLGTDPLYEALRVGGNEGAAAPLEGSYFVNEAYLELELPLLANMAFTEVLDLNVAVRHSDYSNFGDTTNGKAGFRWKPHAQLLLRGNWAEGFRAPSIGDLFFAGTPSFSGVFADPCHPDSQPSPDVRANCAAAGVPAEFELPLFTNVREGGNAALGPETSVTKTLGLVYSPEWFDGFELVLDWYNITIDQPIAGVAPEILINRCYVLGDGASCARIVRNDQGQLQVVDATLENAPDGFETEGFDLSLRWQRATPYGRFSVTWDTAYVDYFGEAGRPDRLEPSSDGVPQQGNSVGTVPFFQVFGAEWRIKSYIELGWSRGPWSTALTGRYFSPLDEDCRFVTNTAVARQEPELFELCDDPFRIVDLDGDGVGDADPQNEIEEAWFFDFQVGWNAPWNGRVTIGVRNAFDHDPPVSYSTLANSFISAYDLPGRFWYVSYTHTFD